MASSIIFIASFMILVVQVTATKDYTVVLKEGEEIVPPQTFVSPNGQYELALSNSNMRVRVGNGTNGTDGWRLFETFPQSADIEKLFLKKGDVWMMGEHPHPVRSYNRAGEPICPEGQGPCVTKLWETSTEFGDNRNPKPVNPRLRLWNDGKLQLCGDDGCYWLSSGTDIEEPCGPKPNSTEMRAHTNALTAGQSLEKDKPIYSRSRRYKLIHQTDGNVVVYRECDGQAVFSTGTFLAEVANATLENDGNLVVYGSQNTRYDYPIWFAEPWKKRTALAEKYTHSELRLYDDGKLRQCEDDNCFWHSSIYRDFRTPEARAEYPPRERFFDLFNAITAVVEEQERNQNKTAS